MKVITAGKIQEYKLEYFDKFILVCIDNTGTSSNLQVGDKVRLIKGSSETRFIWKDLVSDSWG